MPPKYRNVAAVLGTSNRVELRSGCPVSTELETGQLGGFRLDAIRESQQQPAPFRSGRRRPCRERPLGCVDGAVHVGGARLGDARDGGAVVWIDDIDLTAFLGVHPTAVDEQPRSEPVGVETRS